MLKWVKNKLHKNTKNVAPKLDIKYTNEITFLDVEQKEVVVKVRSVGKQTFLYIQNTKGEFAIVLDADAAYFLSSIMADYAENGNLNKIEEILKTEE